MSSVPSAHGGSARAIYWGRSGARGRRVLRLIVPGLLAVSFLAVGVSTPASARTPRVKKPGPPTAVSAVGLKEGAGVSWGPPTSDGGSPITGYTVTVGSGGGSCTTSATSCTVIGLTRDRTYRVHVRASNSKGMSKAVLVEVTPSLTQDCSYIGVDGNLQNCDFAGADFAGLNLTGADLDGADLADADLSGADLTGVGLQGSNLSNSVLTEANLTDANLSGADLSSADLTDTDLSGVSLTTANLTAVSSGEIFDTPSALPPDWMWVNSFLVGPTANLSGAALGSTDLVNADLHDADLATALLSGADLTDADLTGANLEGAQVTGATLTGVALDDTNLTAIVSGGVTHGPSSLPAGWVLADGYLFGPSANLSNANLEDADLTDVPFTGVDLTSADLTGATLIGVSSGGITGTPSDLPANWNLIDGYLIGPGADLVGASLSGVALSDLDMEGVNLTDAVLTNTSLGSDLTDANLTDANLTDADVANADLTGAVLTGTNLDNVVSGSVTGTPSALPTGWSVNLGFLMGPLANLTNADLTGANLTNADLADANLTNVHLVDVNLTNVDLTSANLSSLVSGGISGTPSALPTDWILLDGYLIGPSANLYGASLAGANLSSLNLTGADIAFATLNGADLTDTNLTNGNVYGSNFTGADLLGANFTGAEFLTETIWSNTTCPDDTNSDSDGGTCINDLG
jgi:uncharacterized protein YjbI with pentapeptide repeats